MKKSLLRELELETAARAWGATYADGQPRQPPGSRSCVNSERLVVRIVQTGADFSPAGRSRSPCVSAFRCVWSVT